MSWRNKLSWRWIIRGTCLGLLGLCVGLWGLSYFYTVIVSHQGRSCGKVGVADGEVVAAWFPVNPYEGSPWSGAPGWAIGCRMSDRYKLFTLHFFDGDFLGFSVSRDNAAYTMVDVPFWCPTMLLALLSWIAWRKTRRADTARGFPIEPLASRRENAGG